MVVSDTEVGFLLGAVVVLVALAGIGWIAYIRRRPYEYTKEEVEKIVDDRLDLSRNILKGDIGEHIAPHMKEFMAKYDPQDARFLGGKPVDYIVYKGYSRVYDTNDPLDEIVFVEVKTSKEMKKGPNRNEAKIRDAILAKRVNYDVVTLHFD